MNFKKLALVLAGICFAGVLSGSLAGCSEQSRMEKAASEALQKKIETDSRAEAQSLSSTWLQQAYQDYVVRNSEVKILSSELQGNVGTVKFQIQKPAAELRANLLGIVAKVGPDGERNFNFSDGANAVQNRLGLKEAKAWSLPESVQLFKGPDGWGIKN